MLPPVIAASSRSSSSNANEATVASGCPAFRGIPLSAAADEYGPLMVFASVAEAVACLAGDGLTPKKRRSVRGWDGPALPNHE